MEKQVQRCRAKKSQERRKGSCRAELVSLGSWVKLLASLQLRERTAINGVSVGGSAGSARFKKAEPHKAFG